MKIQPTLNVYWVFTTAYLPQALSREWGEVIMRVGIYPWEEREAKTSLASLSSGSQVAIVRFLPVLKRTASKAPLASGSGTKVKDSTSIGADERSEKGSPSFWARARY